MDLAHYSSIKKHHMRDISNKDSGMEEEKWDTHQGIHMKDNGKMTKNLAPALWIGLPKIKSTKESG